MSDEEKPKGLQLRGDLQINIAEQVLRRHHADSKALNFIVRVKDVYASYPEHMRMPSATSMSFYVDDAEMKNDVVIALRASLESDDLDEFDRTGIEELLAITEI